MAVLRGVEALASPAVEALASPVGVDFLASREELFQSHWTSAWYLGMGKRYVIAKTQQVM